MVSEVEFDKIFNYWWEDLKWSGVFHISWVYVKDVHHVDVQDIRVGGTPIHQLKDGSHVDFEAGRRMLEVFRASDIDSDIFEAFEFMDEREEKLRIKRDSYYEMIKQLKNKGLIPEGMKQGGHYRNGKYGGGHGKKRGSYRGGGGGNGNSRGFRGPQDKEGPAKPFFYGAKRKDDNTEYIKKEEPE